jgi:hypothetical protein
VTGGLQKATTVAVRRPNIFSRCCASPNRLPCCAHARVMARTAHWGFVTNSAKCGFASLMETKEHQRVVFTQEGSLGLERRG